MIQSVVCMIKIPDTLPPLEAHAAPADAPLTIWGMDVRALHDAFWASRGIHVIRRGARAPALHHERFLLLEPSELVLMSPNRVIDELRRARSSGFVIRLTCHDDEQYSESIVAAEDGSFSRFERRYQPRTHRTSWGVITASPDVARAWCAAEDLAGALRAARAAADRGRLARAHERARLWDDHTPSERAHFLEMLQQRWRGAARAIPDTVEIRPGVVAHKTASVDPGACIMGPVWIGANVHILADAAIVGPHIEPDVTVPIATSARGAAVSPVPRAAFTGIPHHRHPSDAAKRLFDIVFSLFALLITAPLYPVVLALIFIEDGRPFFFIHRRQSRGGREFGCIKFRTMFKDAEARKTELMKENHGPQFFMSNDPRVLPVGKFLRKLQLDELPQFVNVLMGDMSVVGPRPSPDAENQCCPPWREARLSVRPGITGLWQVRRTREPQIDFQEWIRYDLEYVRKRSLWLDIKIIAMTVRLMLRGPLASSRPNEKGKFR